MNRTAWLLVIGVTAYLALTVTVAGGVLWLTLWAYNAGGETRADTVSAAVLNTTAATLLWLAIIGGLDMFFTIWQMMQNREDAARRDREREEERKERAARDKAYEEERKAREARDRALEEDLKAREAARAEERKALEEERKAREEARAEERRALEEDRKAREAAQESDRQARAQELAEQRQFHQAVLQRLDAEREEQRREREEYRREQEENRNQREQFFATLLQAEKERSDLLMARFFDVIERLDKRGNNGNGTRSAD